MKIRLGYVAISKTLENVTSSSNLTFSNYKDNNEKLDTIILSNLNALIEILKYNVKNNIHFYRLTSKLIPLATHEEVDFDYLNKYNSYYKKIGKIINSNNMRVDVHPDQFTILNSTKKEVFNRSINSLEYHYNILSKLNIKNKIIVLHIGSGEFGKKKSITRFINNYSKLPAYLKETITLENDDKVYNIKDTLNLCIKLGIPMTLDYHHHICNSDDLIIEDYLEAILNTWNNVPKIHFSSPKSKLKKEFRSHNDYINSSDFIAFLDKLKKVDIDVDIMIEAKAKDEALFRLIRELKYKTNYKFVDETTFIV